MIEADVVAKDLAQFVVRFLRATHGVADDEGAPAVGQIVFEQGDDVGSLVHPSDLNRAAAARSLNGDDLRTAFPGRHETRKRHMRFSCLFPGLGFPGHFISSLFAHAFPGLVGYFILLLFARITVRD